MEIQQETPELIQPPKGLWLMEEPTLQDLSDKQEQQKAKETQRTDPHLLCCPSPHRGDGAGTVARGLEASKSGRQVSGVKMRYFSLNV